MQLPIARPGLASHILAGLCAQWIPSFAPTSVKLQHSSAKPHPPQTTCPAWLQHPVQALPHLLGTPEAVFDLAVAHGMPRAGHSHTGRALCAVVAERRLYICKTPAFSKAAHPTNQLPSLAAAPSAGSTTPDEHCRGCICPCSGPWYAQGWPPTHWQGSLRSGCQVAPPHL